MASKISLYISSIGMVLRIRESFSGATGTTKATGTEALILVTFIGSLPEKDAIKEGVRFFTISFPGNSGEEGHRDLYQYLLKWLQLSLWLRCLCAASRSSRFALPAQPDSPIESNQACDAAFYLIFPM